MMGRRSTKTLQQQSKMFSGSESLVNHNWHVAYNVIHPTRNADRPDKEVCEVNGLLSNHRHAENPARNQCSIASKSTHSEVNGNKISSDETADDDSLQELIVIDEWDVSKDQKEKTVQNNTDKTTIASPVIATDSPSGSALSAHSDMSAGKVTSDKSQDSSKAPPPSTRTGNTPIPVERVIASYKPSINTASNSQVGDETTSGSNLFFFDRNDAGQSTKLPRKAAPIVELNLTDTVVPLHSDQTLYDIALYCDSCQIRVTKESAQNHLVQLSHHSASQYEISKFVSRNLTMPGGSRVWKAECFVNPVERNGADVLFVCLECLQFQAVIATSPHHILYHAKKHNDGKNRSYIKRNPAKDYCAILQAEGERKFLKLQLSTLHDHMSAARHPCLGCQKTFPTSEEAIRHMEQSSHLKMDNNLKDTQDLTLAFCLNCDDETLVTRHQVLDHLWKKHNTPDESISSVKFVIQRYHRLRMDLVEDFSDVYHMIELYDKIPVKEKYRMDQIYKTHRKRKADVPTETDITETDIRGGYISLKATAVMRKRKADVPTETDIRGGHISLKATARTIQQYVCDLCHVTLKDERNACLRHMNTFKHPSVSLYNTVVQPTGEMRLESIHKACVYYDAQYDMQNTVCVCSIEGCNFISSEPHTNIIHQQVIHGRQYSECTVNYFNLESTSSHRNVVGISGGNRFICPTCSHCCQLRRHLNNHMAGMKHYIFCTDSTEIIEIGRCLVCQSAHPGPTGASPHAVYSTETSLLDHLYKHVPVKLKSKNPVDLYYTISCYRKVKKNEPPVPFDSDSQYMEVRKYVLQTLSKNDQVSKNSRKKYRGALKDMR